MTATYQPTYQVDQIWRNFDYLGQIIKVFGNIFEDLFSILQNFEHTLANCFTIGQVLIVYWANNIFLWSHCFLPTMVYRQKKERMTKSKNYFFLLKNMKRQNIEKVFFISQEEEVSISLFSAIQRNSTFDLKYVFVRFKQFK